MTKAKKQPEVIDTSVVSNEPAMDILTDEIIADLTEEEILEETIDAIIDQNSDLDQVTDEIISERTEEVQVESKAIETSIEEELKRHDEFLSRKYDWVEEPIPSELEVYLHALRTLSTNVPLKSKINRLLDEVEQAFQH